MSKIDIEWIFFPLKDIKKAIFASIIILVTLTIIYLSSGIFWTVFSFIILLISLVPIYIPIIYRLTDTSIEIKKVFYTTRKEWSVFRRAEVDKRGILLSPFLSPSRLDGFRGLYIPLPDRDKEKIISYIENKIYERDKK